MTSGSLTSTTRKWVNNMFYYHIQVEGDNEVKFEAHEDTLAEAVHLGQQESSVGDTITISSSYQCADALEVGHQLMRYTREKDTP